jgi:hypothetical protein
LICYFFSLVDRYHQQLFVQIAPYELIGQRWSKSSKLIESPNICWLIEQFNVLSGTVSTSVVAVEHPAVRAGVITWWIAVADELYSHNDFSRFVTIKKTLFCCFAEKQFFFSNSTMAIMSGLLNTSVHRLERTWQIVRKRNQVRHARFEALVQASNRFELLKICSSSSFIMAFCGSEKNYTNLRNAVRKSTPPMLPYLGIFLQDLTFCEDAQKDFLYGELINFEKKVQLASIIQDILLYQSVPYPFAVVDEIQSYLSRFVPLNSEKLYSRSLLLEPR